MTAENEVVQSLAEKNAELIAAFESWLITKNYSIHTRKHYRADARAFAAFLGPKSLAAADRQDALAFLAQRAGTRHTFQSCRVALSTLYRFLKFAGVAPHVADRAHSAAAHIHLSTIRDWFNTGKIDSPEKIGSNYRWTAQQLEALRAIRARSGSRSLLKVGIEADPTEQPS